MPYQFTRIDNTTIRIRHIGPITRDDHRALCDFLRTVEDNLLFDLSGTPVKDLARELLTVRSMLPRTACFGPELPEYVFRDLPGKHYAMYEMRYFRTEDEAYTWLHGDTPRHRDVAPDFVPALADMQRRQIV